MVKIIKKMSKILFATILLSVMSFSVKTEMDSECNILHNGTFKYGNSTTEIKVVIKGNKHIEYHENGKYIIKSKLNWVNDCEYNMTMTEITIPNFPYKVGDIMNVKINKVEGNDIYYTSTVQGKSWDGQLIRIKK